MCDEHVDYDGAARVARRMLTAQGFPVWKANPINDDDFVLISDRFARKLAATSGPIDAAAVARAINALDVPWNDIDQMSQAAIIAESSRALNVGQQVARAVSRPFMAHAEIVVEGTKTAVGRQIDFKLSPSFDAVDRNIVDRVVASQGAYVTNEYGKHAALFSQKARQVVSDGLARGLRPEDITEDLAKAARAVGLKRTKNYWNVAASAMTNRARTHTQLTNYQRAGIERYEFQAITDQRTTDICRALDGRIFTVQSALTTYDWVEDDTHFDAVKDHQPWVRSRKNGDEIDMFIKRRDGVEVPVGTVVRSGVGRADDRGEYRRMMDNSSLEVAGLAQPPLHGLCRSVIVPLT